jgi:hypothetical protein
MAPLMAFLRALARAVGWTVVALALALAGAGLVAQLSHPPGTAARAELTHAGDTRLRAALVAAHADLVVISGQVDRLSVLGRGALAALLSEDTAALTAALDEGGLLVIDIEFASGQLDDRLAVLPGDDPLDALRYSDLLLARRVAFRDALTATAGLARGWTAVAAGALSAARLVDLLTDHDVTVTEAATAGRERRYDDALASLEQAAGLLEAAEDLRDAFGPGADTSTLDDWLRRHREYDAALSALYTALRDAGDRVTDAVREAYRREEAARVLLPSDRRAVEVIVVELGRGGLSRTVIGIEQARGRLALALEDLAEADASG